MCSKSSAAYFLYVRKGLSHKHNMLCVGSSFIWVGRRRRNRSPSTPVCCFVVFSKELIRPNCYGYGYFNSLSPLTTTTIPYLYPHFDASAADEFLINYVNRNHCLFFMFYHADEMLTQQTTFENIIEK